MGCLMSSANTGSMDYGIEVSEGSERLLINSDYGVARPELAKLAKKLLFTQFELSILRELYCDCLDISETSQELLTNFLTSASESVTRCDINDNLPTSIAEFVKPGECLNYGVCVQVLSVFARGSREEQLTFLFCLLDHDNSGELLHSDLHLMVDIFVWTEEADTVRHEQRKDNMFQQILVVLDANDEGRVTFETFIMNTQFISGKLGLEDPSPVEEEVPVPRRERRATEILTLRVRAGLASTRQNRIERNKTVLGGASSSTLVLGQSVSIPIPHAPLSPRSGVSKLPSHLAASLTSPPPASVDEENPLSLRAQGAPVTVSAVPVTVLVPSPAVPFPIEHDDDETPPVPPLLGASMKEGANFNKEWRSDVLLLAAEGAEKLGDSGESNRPSMQRARSVLAMPGIPNFKRVHSVSVLSMMPEKVTASSAKPDADQLDETFAIDCVRVNSLGLGKKRRGIGESPATSFHSPRGKKARGSYPRRRSDKGAQSSQRDLHDRQSAASDDKEECKSVISIQPFVFDHGLQPNRAECPPSPTGTFNIDHITTLGRCHSVRSSLGGMLRSDSIYSNRSKKHSIRKLSVRPSGMSRRGSEMRSPKAGGRTKSGRKRTITKPDINDDDSAGLMRSVLSVCSSPEAANPLSAHPSMQGLADPLRPPPLQAQTTSHSPGTLDAPVLTRQLTHESSVLSSGSAREGNSPPVPPLPVAISLVKSPHSTEGDRGAPPPLLLLDSHLGNAPETPLTPAISVDVATSFEGTMGSGSTLPLLSNLPILPGVKQVSSFHDQHPPVLETNESAHPFDDTTPSASPTGSQSSPKYNRRKRFSSVAVPMPEEDKPDKPDKKHKKEKKKKKKRGPPSHVSTSSNDGRGTPGLLQTDKTGTQSSPSPSPSVFTEDDELASTQTSKVESVQTIPTPRGKRRVDTTPIMDGELRDEVACREKTPLTTLGDVSPTGAPPPTEMDSSASPSPVAVLQSSSTSSPCVKSGEGSPAGEGANSGDGASVPVRFGEGPMGSMRRFPTDDRNNDLQMESMSTPLTKKPLIVSGALPTSPPPPPPPRHIMSSASLNSTVTSQVSLQSAQRPMTPGSRLDGSMKKRGRGALPDLLSDGADSEDKKRSISSTNLLYTLGDEPASDEADALSIDKVGFGVGRSSNSSHQLDITSPIGTVSSSKAGSPKGNLPAPRMTWDDQRSVSSVGSGGKQPG